MFSFFLANNLLAPNQSGFKPGGSSINQLLSITHEIYSSFDNGFEVRSVFLDISKAFNKVWHEGIIFKLQQNGISDDLLNILSDFLRKKKQRVKLNGESYSWTNVNAGAPQGSILGPLLFQSILMICQMAYHLMLNYLLTILLYFQLYMI